MWNSLTLSNASLIELFTEGSKFCKLNHYQISLKTIFKSEGPQNGLMNCPINKIEYALKYLKII